jgi:hypothetical protein
MVVNVSRVLFAVILMNQLNFTVLKHSKTVIIYDLSSLKNIFEPTIQEYYLPTNDKVIDKIRYFAACVSIQTRDLDE